LFGFLLLSLISFFLISTIKRKTKEHGHRTTNTTNSCEQEHRRHNTHKLSGTRTTRATLHVFYMLVLFFACCGVLKLLFVSDMILCSGWWYNVLCSFSLYLSLFVFVLCPLSLIWLFCLNKQIKRKQTQIKKSNTNDEHTHRRSNTTPNQAPIFKNKEHDQQHRTWNQN